MKNKLLFLFAFGSIFFLSSFNDKSKDEKRPDTITRTLSFINGDQVEKTIILIDGNTSREDLIHTCAFLAQENVQLTFEKIIIGRSFLGLVGKNRIRIADGKIELSNGLSQSFKAGGATSFKFIKIQYSNTLTAKSKIEMIEIVD